MTAPEPIDLAAVAARHSHLMDVMKTDPAVARLVASCPACAQALTTDMPALLKHTLRLQSRLNEIDEQVVDAEIVEDGPPPARVDADTPKQPTEKIEVDRATLHGIAWDLRNLADRIAQLADGRHV